MTARVRPTRELLRLHARLDPVQVHAAGLDRGEGQVEDQPQPVAEQAAPCIGVVGVVADGDRSEPAADHAVQVHPADHRLALLDAVGEDQEGAVVRRTAARCAAAGRPG